MLFVEAPVVAAQAAAETAGTAVTGASVVASTAPMTAVVPMASDPVSLALHQAILAHGAQFLAMAGLNVAQRAMFAAQVGTSGGVYMAGDALSAVALTL